MGASMEAVEASKELHSHPLASIHFHVLQLPPINSNLLALPCTGFHVLPRTSPKFYVTFLTLPRRTETCKSSYGSKLKVMSKPIKVDATGTSIATPEVSNDLHMDRYWLVRIPLHFYLLFPELRLVFRLDNTADI